MKRKHTLSVLVKNNSGVLSHVASLFTRRGYNIDSLSVAETQNPEKSVITIVVNEDERMVAQIERQLYKLMDVVSIEDLANVESRKRELVLAIIKTPEGERREILSLVEVFQATIADMTEDRIMVELSGNPRKVNTFINSFKRYGIERMARTGVTALPYPSGETGEDEADED